MKSLRDESDSTYTLSPSIVEGPAGFAAGIAATLVAHPFDLVKTRLQSTTILFNPLNDVCLNDVYSQYQKPLSIWKFCRDPTVNH